MYGDKEVIVTSYDPSELRFCLSGNDALTLLELIQKCLNCNTKEDYLAIFPKIRELLPYNCANSFLAHYDADNTLVLAYNANINTPIGWLREYQAKNYLQRDVKVRENFKSYKVQHWDFDRLKLYKQDEGLISLYAEFGVIESYVHGSRFPATGKNGSMFCFASPSIQFDKRADAILEFVIPHLHLALSQLYSNKQLEWNKVVITQRQKEVLNWLKQGKSSWDISVILGISECTVNYHIYKIMQKLGATNRPQALALAARRGLIDFS